MLKKGQVSANGNAKSQASLGEQIFKALTEQEISQMLDGLLAVVSDSQLSCAFSQLQPDTRKTLNQIIAPSPTVEQSVQTEAQPTYDAKLSQTWSQLWQEWYQIIEDATQSEGKYISQSASWEEPYFDEYALVEDLEAVAVQMKPLVRTAFENDFNENDGFAASLLEAESEISDNLPDWMEIQDGIYLQPALTHCLLEWEWLLVQREGQDGFKFAENIREWSEKFCYTSLDRDTVIDFFSDLHDDQKKIILNKMIANRETSLWKHELDNINSHWHIFYMEMVQKFATPEMYLQNLRATIAQSWQNGLPVIEDLLAKQEYGSGLVVIQEILDSLLKAKQNKQLWTPETSLLFVARSFSYGDDNRENEKTLLRYHQQIARELGDQERVNALEIQHIAFEYCYDWSSMFKVFAETPVSEDTRQALFTSWRDHIVRGTKPYSHYANLYAAVKAVDVWWLHWLLDSIKTPKKGHVWFRRKIIEWVDDLPGDRRELGGEYKILQILMKDLTEIYYQGKSPYPQFYRVVVEPQKLSAPDDVSRRKYLQEYAPPDLMENLMAYWQANLHNFVPKPENSQGSDYTTNVEWMSALLELAPQDYQKLLSEWRVQHKRRSNLWKAMKNFSLD